MVAFNTTTLVSGSVTKKKTLPKLECADKKLLEESCVRNFRNPLFAKPPLFEILGHFQKLFWAKILGVRNFRVFEILGHLPYTLFFLFLLKNKDCGYSLEPPRRGGSNE